MFGLVRTWAVCALLGHVGDEPCFLREDLHLAASLLVFSLALPKTYNAKAKPSDFGRVASLRGRLVSSRHQRRSDLSPPPTRLGSFSRIRQRCVAKRAYRVRRLVLCGSFNHKRDYSTAVHPWFGVGCVERVTPVTPRIRVDRDYCFRCQRTLVP